MKFVQLVLDGWQGLNPAELPERLLGGCLEALYVYHGMSG